MLTLLALACVDLPEGWEDAVPISDFSQRECSGDPYGEYDETVTATLADGDLDFVWDEAPFRCAQDVEGFYRTEGDLLQVLVQPVDMNPRAVAGCDCLYRLDFTVPDWSGPWEAWRRWDNINDPNDPELIDVSDTR